MPSFSRLRRNSFARLIPAALAAACCLPAARGAEPVSSPLKDAALLVSFGEQDDPRITASGDVELGIALDFDAASESLSRGDDARIARFGKGGWLSFDEETNRILNSIKGRQITFGARLRAPEGTWRNAPVMSKHGGHGALTFNMFFIGDAVGAEAGATINRRPLQGLAPRGELRDPDDFGAWRDVICRIDGARLEFFVDGRCCDEDFMLGDLRENNVPFLIGAQYDSPEPGAKPRAEFEGEIDWVAVWDRALSDDEIVFLSGGAEKIDARSRTERIGEESMQYWTPPNAYGVGDCMPFSAEGVFHFMFLLDKGRHGAKNGFGAHQWIQTTSTDLVHWKHEPFVVAIDDQNEGSICTGSVFYHNGKYYAFYANRAVEYTTPDGVKHNTYGLLCLATSDDGIHFTKESHDPLFLLPEGYAQSTRDPFVFQDPEDGKFYMLITTSYKGRGCWARAVSDDLLQWRVIDPVYSHRPGEPECPDLFKMGDDYYLVANHLNGYLLKSKSPRGPWEAPSYPNILMNGLVNVPKTAPWKDGRRIICGWTRERGFGGSAVFHELVRRDDGSLAEKFVPEMRPATDEPVFIMENVDSPELTVPETPQKFYLKLDLSFDYAKIDSARDVVVEYAPEHRIRVVFAERKVWLNDVLIENVDMTEGRLSLECYAPNHIVDLCVNESRTATYANRDAETRALRIINESPELVRIERVEVAPVLSGASGSKTNE